MATTYSTSFYTSGGAVRKTGRVGLDAGGLLGASSPRPSPRQSRTGSTSTTACRSRPRARGDPGVPVPVLRQDRLGRRSCLMPISSSAPSSTVYHRHGYLRRLSSRAVLRARRHRPGGMRQRRTEGRGDCRLGGGGGASNLAEATLPAWQTGSTMGAVLILGSRSGTYVTGLRSRPNRERRRSGHARRRLRKMPTPQAILSMPRLGPSPSRGHGRRHVASSKTGLAEVVAFGETFYVLITATTAGSTDIRFLGISVTTTAAASSTNLTWVNSNLLIPGSDSGTGHIVFKVGAAAATPAAANLTFIPLIL